MIVGLVGGVASGKSLVAQRLAEHGARVLDVDRLGHEVLTEPEVIACLTARWGGQILTDGGAIDRARVARRVFAPAPDGPPELEFLEQTTHPRIGARIDAQIATWLRESSDAPIVLDAALLLKAGWDRRCDQVIYVDSPVERRRDRAVARGWSEREFASREAAQGPMEEKRRRATWVVDNSGTATELAEQVERFWREVVERPGASAAESVAGDLAESKSQ